jgi:hypothetical protein
METLFYKIGTQLILISHNANPPVKPDEISKAYFAKLTIASILKILAKKNPRG